MKNFIIFSIFAIYFAIVWSDEIDLAGTEGEPAYFKACKAETHVTDADLEVLMYNNLTDIKENVKCHVKCVLGKRGVFRAGGIFNEDGAVKFLFTARSDLNTTAEAAHLANICKVQNGTTNCEIAFKIGMCFVEN